MGEKSTTWIVFDTETSGAYPLGSEVIEIGAIKFINGVESDHLQILIRPKKAVPDEVVAIHNITNEMLRDQPSAMEAATQVANFFEADFYVAHHAPFDLGFMAYFFESVGMPLPQGFGICTSILARKAIKNVQNHKLQTLANAFGLDVGRAHRALDDARTCAALFKIICQSLGINPRDGLELQAAQGYELKWNRFSLQQINYEWFSLLMSAIELEQDLDVIYKKNHSVSERRKIKPLGIVRTPLDGDYVPAWCYRDQKRKRFMLDQFLELHLSLPE